MIQQINEYIQAHRQEILRDLTALAGIPSIQGDARPCAPFGDACARSLEFAADLYRSNGFDATIFAESGYGLAGYGEGDKYLGVFGHLDVVPVTPADWMITAPFDILEKDGYLFGRGVNDNKSGCIATLYAMRAIRDLKLPVRNRIVAYMGTNEESGMNDIKAFAREQPLPAAAIVPDSGYPVSLGELGILRLDLKSAFTLKDVLSIEGGEAYNIVLPLIHCSLRNEPGLLQSLSACSEEWLEITASDDAIHLTAKGVAAHAAHPELGDSALRRLSSVLADCDALHPDDRAQFRVIAHALSDHNGRALDIAFQDEKLGPLTCANGIVRVSDGHLVFTLDIRSGAALSHEEMVRRIERVLSEGRFAAAVRNSSRAFTIDPQNPIALAMIDVYRSVTGNAGAEPFYMKGGTYCKYLPNAFATGACTIGTEGAGLPFGHGGAHQADECLSIDGLLQGIVVLAGMMLAMDALI